MSAPRILVHEHKLGRLVDRLRVESDPNRRKILRLLAIAEEDRYGERQAKMDKVEVWVREGEARIARQHRLVDRFATASPHRDAAQRLLNNLEELQALLIQFQGALHDAEQRSAL